jgi:16S rRNA (guanine966-N2)-methyltransferase
MRVIAGSLKGRQFQSPSGHRTHPMSEKMRGAMFGVLGDIEGLTVLDAFAGSGALSFEALSRSAKSALMLDDDKTAQDAITANILSLGVSKARFIRANAISWSRKNAHQKFDLLLTDPPYDKLPFPVIEKIV